MEAVNYSDSHFRQAIEKLTIEVENRITKLNDKANTDESKLTKIYDEIGIKLKAITEDHLNRLSNSYDEWSTSF